MLHRGKSSENIAEALRADICLSVDGQDTMLHEVALAQRFGVSRTPIRQALQRLAYERMIAVKSGVGSVIVALDPERRDDDLQAATALIEAVAKCAPTTAPPKTHAMTVAGILGMFEMGETKSVEDYFEIRSRFLFALSEMIENPILNDAFRAAYWRLIRWRVADFHTTPAASVAQLGDLLKQTAKALTVGSVNHGMLAVARIEGGSA
ncbi:MAG: GntR family transcriptional regulator [Sedimentitalea sp.]